jgi:acetylglutamate synthase
VSITRPAELAKELFTHKGSGTLIRRGERVGVHTDWSRLDLARMRELIEASFRRPLAADYFERTRVYRAYVSENYRAALILTHEEGFPYLDKFAVADDAQGEGLGRAAWQVMRDENSKLFWRSRHDNLINTFYDAECDGCYKQPRWKVYWYGIHEFADIERCVAHCRERQATLGNSLNGGDAPAGQL